MHKIEVSGWRIYRDTEGNLHLVVEDQAGNQTDLLCDADQVKLLSQNLAAWATDKS